MGLFSELSKHHRERLETARLKKSESAQSSPVPVPKASSAKQKFAKDNGDEVEVIDDDESEEGEVDDDEEEEEEEDEEEEEEEAGEEEDEQHLQLEEQLKEMTKSSAAKKRVQGPSIESSPARTVTEAPKPISSSLSSNKLPNLIIKKDLKKEQSPLNSKPVIKRSNSPLKLISDLPMPPIVHSPVKKELKKEESKPRPLISDLPMPPSLPVAEKKPSESTKSPRVKSEKPTPSPKVTPQQTSQTTPPGGKAFGKGKTSEVGRVKREAIRKKRAKLYGSTASWGERSVETYEIINPVGEGTYGQVYKGRDKDTGKNISFSFSLKWRSGEG